mmetsp:Transcript_55701/g.120367  ORF Transcript_55701/g.120367 Transcript_55701/m.120367 type:complete len:115 (+) Transcript_55701:513-857(+)
MVGAGVSTELLDNSTTPANPKACQGLCEAHAGCEYFSFLDQATPGNWTSARGVCVLMEALSCVGTMYSTSHGIVSGPKTCPTATTAAASQVSFAWRAPSSAVTMGVLGSLILMA